MNEEPSNKSYRWQKIPRREGSKTRRVELGLRARDHVTEIATDWGGALGAEVLALGRPMDRVWTYLGASEEPPPLGDHLGDSLMDLTDVVEEIESHLGTDEKHSIVFRHATAEPNDPWLQRFDVPRFSFGKEVYHYLRGAHPQPAIAEILRVTHSTWRFGVLTSMSSVLVGEGDPTAISELAHHAPLAVVSAWIGDGDLLWDLRASPGS
jgi:hypothetical protein